MASSRPSREGHAWRLSMRVLKQIVVGCLSAVLVAVAHDASAQGVDTTPTKEGYRYVFVDDPLDALGFGEHIAQIKVRQPPARTLLLRLRTTFVPEMLKTVENH
jgi:hypothetical protein